MVTFTQWQQQLTATATLMPSDPKHLNICKYVAVVAFVCRDSNIYPTAVTVTLINNSSIYTQWYNHLQVMAAVTFSNSSGNRFLVSKLCR